jgi:hypothetical protein
MSQRVSGEASYSCFLRDEGVRHGVREERRKSERYLQSSKGWKDAVAVFAPYKLLIRMDHMVMSSSSLQQS